MVSKLVRNECRGGETAAVGGHAVSEVNRRDYFRLSFAELPGTMQIIEVGQRPITTDPRPIDILDASGGGLLIVSDQDLPIRKEIVAQFEFTINKVHFAFRGTFVRKLDDRKTYQYGVAFIDTDDRHQGLLVSVLGRLQVERRNKAGA